MIKVRSHFILIVMLLMTSTLACKSNQSGEQANKQTAGDNANAETQPGGISGAKVAGGRVFRGKVGGNSVQMTLNREGDQLVGTYSYQKVGSEISLKGSINGQGDFSIQEFDNSGTQTGLFKGKWSEPAGRPVAILDGTWTKPNSKQELSFYATEQIVQFTNGLHVATKVIKEESKKPRYSVDVEYPELTGAPMPNTEKFNQEVKNLVDAEVRDFKQGVMEAGSDYVPEDSETGSDIQIDYTVMLASNDLVSVSFYVSTYSQGAAHPNGYTRVVNCDLKAGKSLKLADLFKPNSDYLNAISRYSISDLKKQAGQDADVDWIEKGAGPESDNYASWNIAKKGLAITFDSYQVASYAEGPKYVIVPYAILNDSLRPDGPISSVGK